jgi:hypothetical protein
MDGGTVACHRKPHASLDIPLPIKREGSVVEHCDTVVNAVADGKITASRHQRISASRQSRHLRAAL